MKIAKYYGLDDIRIETLPLPKIGRGEILIEVKACGICGTDVTEWYMKPRVPTFFGHEPAGVIAEIGEGVEGLAVGERVFVHHHVPCFVCHYCRRGSYTLCPTFKSTRIYPGGFAEYIRVPRLNVERDTLKLPEDISFEQATLIEPIGTCIRGIKRANVQPGDTVAILGAGFTGLIHSELARLFGAAKVILVDSVDFRLEKAHEFGADCTVDFKREDVLAKIKDLNEGRGVDIVIVTSGNPKAVEGGVKIAGKGSTLYLFATFRPESYLPIDLHQLFFSEITLVTSYSASPLDTRDALKLMETGRISSKELITHRFALDEIQRAVDMVVRAEESLKVVIVMDEANDANNKRNLDRGATK